MKLLKCNLSYSTLDLFHTLARRASDRKGMIMINYLSDTLSSISGLMHRKI